MDFKQEHVGKHLFVSEEGVFGMEKLVVTDDFVGTIRTVDEGAGVVTVLGTEGIKTLLSIEGKVLKIKTTKEKLAEPAASTDGGGFNRGR